MKLFIPALLFLPTLAYAQQTQPSAQALWPMLSESVQREAVLREELLQTQSKLRQAEDAQRAAEAKGKTPDASLAK